MVFPVVTYGCESWTIKKAEHQRMSVFKLWFWRRLLRVPSNLKYISLEYSLEGLLLKLKLQYFGHLMQRTDSFEMILMLGKIEGTKRRGWQRMKWLDDVTDSMDMGLSKLQELVMDREVWRTAVHAVTKSQTWPSDWTEMWDICLKGFHFFCWYLSLPSQCLFWPASCLSPERRVLRNKVDYLCLFG